MSVNATANTHIAQDAAVMIMVGYGKGHRSTVHAVDLDTLGGEVSYRVAGPDGAICTYLTGQVEEIPTCDTCDVPATNYTRGGQERPICRPCVNDDREDMPFGMYAGKLTPGTLARYIASGAFSR